MMKKLILTITLLFVKTIVFADCFGAPIEVSYADGSIGSVITCQGSAPLRIESDGAISYPTAFVGANQLVLSRDSSTGLTIFSPNTCVGSIYFADQDSAVKADSSYNHALDRFQWSFNNSTVLAALGQSAGFESFVKIVANSDIRVQDDGIISYPAASVDANQLVISQDGGAGITIFAPNTENSRINFADQDDNNPGAIFYSHINGRMNIRAGDVNQWYFRGDGALVYAIGDDGAKLSFDSLNNSGIRLDNSGETVVYRAGDATANSGTHRFQVYNSTPVAATAFEVTDNIVNVSTGLSLARASTAVTADFPLKTNIFGVTDTSSARTITLQSADLIDGKIVIIKDESDAAGTNNITIDTEGAETIDGVSSLTITVDSGVFRAYSDGSNWFTF